MSARRPRLQDGGQPRGLTAEEAAFLLGFSRDHFDAMLPKMLRAGFPPKDPLLDRYDRKAIDCWWDVRSGIASAVAEDRGLQHRLKEFRGKGAGDGQTGNPSPGHDT